MTMALFAVLSYERSLNLGDDIQTIAAARHLPRVDRVVDRDRLDVISGPPLITMMNGWFLEDPSHWPPSDSIVPLLTGFHITPTNDSPIRLLADAGADWFRRQGPVGCRDQYTADLLCGKGIDASYVGCPTSTLPERPAGTRRQVFLVHTEGIVVPSAIGRGAIRVEQRAPNFASPRARRRLAVELLRWYAEDARLVVTTKIHCALPCAAMGIPVVFVGDPADPRMTPVTETVGINAFRADRFATGLVERRKRHAENRRLAREVDWDPSAVDMSAVRHRVTADIGARLAHAVPRT